jgi:SAM-dependent methyltransferase
VDLVTVAQAAHWLLLPAFYEEVCRVLKPGGLCVMWCYGVLTCEGDEVNQAVQAFCQHIAPWWPPERVHVENGYRDLPFPFAREMPPPFEMSVNWHLSELIGYLGSSSAATRYRAEQGEDPMSALEARLLPLWGSAPRRITWPLSVLAGRCVISAKPPCNASSR